MVQKEHKIFKSGWKMAMLSCFFTGTWNHCFITHMFHGMQIITMRDINHVSTMAVKTLNNVQNKILYNRSSFKL